MFENSFKRIDNILHTDSGSATELDYVEQTSWILFLKSYGILKNWHEVNARQHQRLDSSVLLGNYLGINKTKEVPGHVARHLCERTHSCASSRRSAKRWLQPAHARLR